MEAARQVIPLSGLADPRERGLESFLAGERAVGRPHRVAQVVGTDEYGVEAGHGIDLVGDLDRIDVLGLDDDEDLVVGAAVVFLGRCAEIERVHAAADRSIAARWVLGRRDDRPGLVGVHHHRGDDPHGPAVEDHLDVLVLPGGNPCQGNAAGVGDRGEHVGGGLDIGVGVLHVDGQPGEPHPRHEPGRRDAAQREPGSDLRLAGTQRPFDWILFQLGASSSSGHVEDLGGIDPQDIPSFARTGRRGKINDNRKLEDETTTSIVWSRELTGLRKPRSSFGAARGLRTLATHGDGR